MFKSIRWCLLFSAIITLTPLAIKAFPSTDSSSRLPLPNSEIDMVKILSEYNTKLAKVENRVVLASWAVATDVGNKEKEEKLVRYHIKILNSNRFTIKYQSYNYLK